MGGRGGGGEKKVKGSVRWTRMESGERGGGSNKEKLGELFLHGIKW